MDLENFISEIDPHGHQPSAPPFGSLDRHEWESKILYSVKDKLSGNCSLLDLGCGSQTLKYNLTKRFPNSKYYGIDPKLGNMEEFPNLVKEINCCVAGSVFTHLEFNNIKNILNTLKPLFDNGGEFGFTFFLDAEPRLYQPFHYGPNTWGVSSTTLNQYQEYCEKNKLKFTLLPFDFKVDHLIEHEGKVFSNQNFANIKI